MTEQWGLARKSDEPARVYETLREVFSGQRRRTRKKPPTEDLAFTPGRDPEAMSDIFPHVAGDLGWEDSLATARLFVEWRDIVGQNTADHAVPVTVTERQLTIQASSSAWATQLRLMRHELLSALAEKIPELTIDTIQVLAPGAPSWKNGPRRVPGRGPRDTYG